jgi:TIR domain
MNTPFPVPAGTAPQCDYFISYNQADQAWAEWVGQQAQALGLTVVLQAWDFEAGENFVAAMHSALQRCTRLLMILSRNYLNARYTQEEWQAAFALDQRIVPVKVDDCKPPGLLAPIAYVDLHGKPEAQAALLLRRALRPAGAPSAPVPFPGRI